MFLVVHDTRTVRCRRCWCVPVVLWIILEIVNDIATWPFATVNPYQPVHLVLKYVLTITAPIILAATTYTAIYMLALRHGRSYCLLTPKALLWFFVSSDVVATVTRVASCALVRRESAAQQQPTPATNAILIGLAYQTFAMTVFLLMTVAFIARARHYIRYNQLSVPTGVLTAAIALISMQTLFQLANKLETRKLHELHVILVFNVFSASSAQLRQ